MPKSVEASTLIKASHPATGEKPAKIGQERLQDEKKVAKSTTAVELRLSSRRSSRPLAFRPCLSACRDATAGIIAGQAVEIRAEEAGEALEPVERAGFLADGDTVRIVAAQP